MFLAAANGHLGVVQCLISSKADLEIGAMHHASVQNIAVGSISDSQPRPAPGGINSFCLQDLEDSMSEFSSEAEGSGVFASSDLGALTPRSSRGSILAIESEGILHLPATPIYMAALHGYTQIVKCLIEAGARIDRDDSANPLYAAAFEV